jgi:phosphoribosylanthranilate isomerase
MRIHLKIKVCGMREDDNIRQLIGLPIDYIGFIFYSKTPRYAGKLNRELLESIPDNISKVGVFVNSSIDDVIRTVKEYKLDYAQLHGNEDETYCKKLKDEGIKIIKTFPVADLNEKKLKSYANACNYYLFDSSTRLYGGSGIKFNWDILTTLDIPLPFFLSGGIGEEHVDEILQFRHNQLYAIDLNSKFELKPGLKNIELLENFIKKIK